MRTAGATLGESLLSYYMAMCGLFRSLQQWILPILPGPRRRSDSRSSLPRSNKIPWFLHEAPWPEKHPTPANLGSNGGQDEFNWNMKTPDISHESV